MPDSRELSGHFVSLTSDEYERLDQELKWRNYKNGILDLREFIFDCLEDDDDDGSTGSPTEGIFTSEKIIEMLKNNPQLVKLGTEAVMKAKDNLFKILTKNKGRK